MAYIQENFKDGQRATFIGSDAYSRLFDSYMAALDYCFFCYLPAITLPKNFDWMN